MFSFQFKIILKNENENENGIEFDSENEIDFENNFEIEIEKISNTMAYEITDRIEYFLMHSIKIEKNNLNINTFYNTIYVQNHDIYNIKKRLALYDNELKIEKSLFIKFSF